MKRLLTGILLLLAAPAVQAEGILDWLPSASGSSAKQQAPADDARLLTLEPEEAETYPRISGDGRYLLVHVDGGRKAWVSRRAAENGDPLNVVSEDERAFDSVHWFGEAHVRFLSERAAGLGLWQRYADGKGVFRRTHELTGMLTQPVSLPDGSIVAVRLKPIGRTLPVAGGRHDAFDNWQPKGVESHIVRIAADGSEVTLSAGINPAASPDGRWIAFTMPIGRSWHLFIVRPDGSELTQLTDERCADVQPTWSADGKWIVFTSNRGAVDLRTPSRNNWDIWAIDREGRELIRLTEDEARDGAPTVAPDGKVYFHSDRKISRQLQEDRQVKGRTGGFHIWTVDLPER